MEAQILQVNLKSQPLPYRKQGVNRQHSHLASKVPVKFSDAQDFARVLWVKWIYFPKNLPWFCHRKKIESLLLVHTFQWEREHRPGKTTLISSICLNHSALPNLQIQYMTGSKTLSFLQIKLLWMLAELFLTHPKRVSCELNCVIAQSLHEMEQASLQKKKKTQQSKSMNPKYQCL